MPQPFYWFLHSPLIWPLILVGGFLVLLFFVSLFERRWTYPYIPIRASGASGGAHDGASPAQRPTLAYSDGTPDPTTLPKYVRLMSDDALATGFVFHDMVANAKPMCRTFGTLWYSPERDILLLSVAGTVLNMPAFQTTLFTPLKDGRFLLTTDNNDEGDRSGLYVTQRVIRQRLRLLMDAHRKRINSLAGQTGIFPQDSALDALLGIYEARVDRLVAAGTAMYYDAGKLHWHYTAWGAFRNCVGFFVQFAQSIPQAARIQGKPVASHEIEELGMTVQERYGKPAGAGV